MDNSSLVDLLRIALPQDPSASVEWQAFDSARIPAGQGNCAIDALPACRTLEWILPASAVAGHLIPVPENAGRQLNSMIDQALEDTLLGAREDAHIVIGQPQPEGRQVWVCSKRWLAATLECWNQAQRQPDRAFAIYDLLPGDKRTTLAASGDGFVFRTATGQVGSLDDAELARALLGPDVEPIENLLVRPLQPEATSLLTGAFAPASQFRFDPAHYRRSAWLAGALALVLLAMGIGRWQQLELREKSLKEEIRQTFAAAFPGTPIVDPVMQWESKRRELAGDSGQRDALDQLAGFAQTLGNIQPRSAEFRDGAIRVVLSESDVARIRPQLEQSGQEFNFAPAESGFSRLDVRVKTK